MNLVSMVVSGMVGGGGTLLALWVMSGSAKRDYPVTALAVPQQDNIDAKIAAWAAQNGYQLQTDTGHGEIRYLKGGWLTNITELVWCPATEQLLIYETMNFLVARRSFAIDAPTFLDQPMRLHRIKKINLLLQDLQMSPLEIK